MAIEQESPNGYSLDTCNSKQYLSNRLLFRHKIIPPAFDRPIRRVPNNRQILGISLVLQNVSGRLCSAKNSISILMKYNKIQFFFSYNRFIFLPISKKRVSLINTACGSMFPNILCRYIEQSFPLQSFFSVKTENS